MAKKNDKPEGPVFVDMSAALVRLPVRDLIHLCNVAMNSMSLRQMAKVSHDAGLEINFRLSDQPPQ